MLELVTLDCPYCGESFASQVDVSAGAQTYTEDCAVCCRPIIVVVHVDEEGELESVSTRREQD